MMGVVGFFFVVTTPASFITDDDHEDSTVTMAKASRSHTTKVTYHVTLLFLKRREAYYHIITWDERKGEKGLTEFFSFSILLSKEFGREL
jgi:hypothetical protein